MEQQTFHNPVPDDKELEAQFHDIEYRVTELVLHSGHHGIACLTAIGLVAARLALCMTEYELTRGRSLEACQYAILEGFKTTLDESYAAGISELEEVSRQ